VIETTPGDIQFEFPKSSNSVDSGGVTLRTVVSQYLGSAQSSKASADKLYQILGRLRWLRYSLQRYNTGAISNSAEFLQYWRRHTLSLLSGFGFRAGQSSSLDQISVAGLEELVAKLESLNVAKIEEGRRLNAAGLVTFDSLSELFRPGNLVKASTVSRTTPCVFRATESFFEERRTLFGSQKNFHVTLELVVSVGDHFSVATFSEVFTSWSGVQARKLSEFAYQPLSPAEEPTLCERGVRAVELATGGAKYLAYNQNSFFVHNSGRSRQHGSALAKTGNRSQTQTGGRVMIDMARGASLGHYPCRGVDEATLAIIQLSERYQQWMSKRSQLHADLQDDDTMLIWENVPEEFQIICWPALVGFSFTTKVWGHVLVDGLSRITFQDQAFDRLVLSKERKQLIRAVVRHGTLAQHNDLVGGKQGGLIFLLHGPPGVGKTLTAEATAEVLQRPLYYVTMGELGVNPDDLEQRLGEVLDLCAQWDAIAVLDEADVFLETRRTSDLVRNAMVCVMLRILEYHPGILFLTTNRVRTLDPAFESRITMAMQYEALNHEDRVQVWKNQLEGIQKNLVSEYIDLTELAGKHMNGRQIKNAVRLGLSLAMDQESQLNQSILMKTIELTSLGRRNMAKDDAWDKATSLE
jgi:AAA+ superfamily predicted ATPase